MWLLHSRARKRNFRTQHQRNANVRIVSEQCHMATGFCDGYIRYSFFMLKKNKIPETHQCKSDRDPEHFPFFFGGESNKLTMQKLYGHIFPVIFL